MAIVRLMLVGIFLVALQPWSAGAAEMGVPRRVFIVNSYHPEYFWSARQQEGIREALKGIDAVYEEFFMDTKRHPEPEWLERKRVECLDAIKRFRPDVVFTGDDNATKAVAKHLVGQSVPVVFYGVNGEPEAYGLLEPGHRTRPGRNVTGVLERHFYVDTARLLETVCTANGLGLERIYLVTDASYTSTKLFEFLRNEDWNLSAEVIFLPQISTVEQYRDTIRSIDGAGAAVFIYNLMTIRKPDGSLMHDRELMRWTSETLTIPTVAFHESYIQEGALLGILVSGYSQAREAGRKGRKILLGASPGDLPINAPDKGNLALNSTTLRRLGLKVPLSVLLGATVYR